MTRKRLLHSDSRLAGLKSFSLIQGELTASLPCGMPLRMPLDRYPEAARTLLNDLQRTLNLAFREHAVAGFEQATLLKTKGVDPTKGLRVKLGLREAKLTFNLIRKLLVSIWMLTSQSLADAANTLHFLV